MNDLRDLPAVEHILNSQVGSDWQDNYGRPLTLQAIRTTLDTIRSEFRESKIIPDENSLKTQIQSLLEDWIKFSLEPVINATGVILHTNLGRAPLSQDALQAIQSTASAYSNLEFDLIRGKRGSRLTHAEDMLKRLTSAEAAMVVNNNAAAVMLILTALARRRGVVIARSQLIEIGGGFRIPDVMKQSGARLIEVGTTNRVHLSDYTRAIQEEKAILVMRAHRSNFQIVGFTSEPDLSEIVTAAHLENIPVVDDLGSGSFFATDQFGLGHEPTINETLESGVDLVCFSGDKLLGGPQAGIILGRDDLVKKLKKHPLARAIRADKLCLAALSATLRHYLRDEAVEKIPIWKMISASPESIRQRAETWVELLGLGKVIPGESTIGGGSLPGQILPTYNVAIYTAKPSQLIKKLRNAAPPLIARVVEDKVLLDPRTVLEEQDGLLIQNIKSAINTQ